MSEDPRIRALAYRTISLKKIWGLWQIISGHKGPAPANLAQAIEAIPKRLLTSRCWREKERLAWEKLQSQGTGIEVFKSDKVSNKWFLKLPPRLSDSDFIIALKIRSNTLPTLARFQHGRPNKTAPYLSKDRETTRHIISHCKSVQKLRMANHNMVVRALAKAARGKGWVTEIEPRIRDSRGKLGIPDLIMEKDGRGLVLDVTIPFEASATTLAAADSKKQAKYKPYTDAILAAHPQMTQVDIRGFPIGARGKWYEGADAILALIDLPRTARKALACRLAKMVLANTVRLVKAHYKLIKK